MNEMRSTTARSHLEAESPGAPAALVPDLTRLRIVHVVDSLDVKHGGPSRSIPALCESLGQAGCEILLVAQRSSKESLGAGIGSARMVTPPRDLFGAWLPGGSLSRALHEAIDSSNVVHDHGLWLSSNHLVARLAGRLDTPRLVSVRGMLAPWALAHGRLKKQLAWRLYQRRDLESAEVLHATSVEELAEIRRAGLQQPIAMIPNGISVPRQLRSVAIDRQSKRRVLFLSRLHEKKGAGDLLEAWARLQPSGWELVLAGPDSGAGRLLRKRATELGLSTAVSFLDGVADEDKWQLYQSADLFVLPTRNENFGLVIGEALACGVPVLTTTAAPWPWLESHRCGWRTDVGPAPLVECLRFALSLPQEELREMGRRGRQLVEQQFSWAAVAQSMAAVYQWMSGSGARPPEVHVD